MLRKILASLIAGVGIYGCTVGDLTISLNKDFFKHGKRVISNSDLEERIRVFEPNVAKLIKSDYTKKRKKGELSFAFSEYKYKGYFNPYEDTIIIPLNTRSKKELLDSLSEEIAHAMTDSKKHKGIFYSSRYQGPSIEEITQKMHERFQQQDMVEIRKRFEKILELIYTLDEEKKLRRQLHEDGIEVIQKISKKNIKKENIERFKEISQKITEKRELYNRHLRNEKAKNLYKKITNGFNSLTDEELDYFLNFIRQVLTSTKEMGKQFCELDERISKSYPGLEIQTNPYDYESYSDPAKDAKKQMDQEFSFEEQFGKTIYSLYNLHYGETTIGAYELDEPMLQFLKGFILDGASMFKKQIEKYRVGKQMVRDGISPRDVKKRLMLATEFEYKGKKYFWPDNNFTIKGNIPDEFSPEYLFKNEN